MNPDKPISEWPAPAPPKGGWYGPMMAVILVLAVLTDAVPFLFAFQPHPGHSDRRLFACLLCILIPAPWALVVKGRSRLKRLVAQTKADPAILELVSVTSFVVLTVTYAVVIVAINSLFSCWK